ncbi:MAG: hypothetical protein NTY38_17485 [Acidobacteria bacterium]|nr:hypothetical protein [Acidobacteriota bacterium]
MKVGPFVFVARWRTAGWNLLAIALALATAARAGEWPYFVTYSHQMEEPGNLEIATRSVTGHPAGGSRFLGTALELEYGVNGWWTTELYLDGQTTRGESSFFTGYRWENRFRLLSREHWLNPVLYVEYEKVNGADRALLAVVGHDGQEDLAGSRAEGRLEHKREVEAKLILGSNFRGWNISENFIAEKNLAHEPFEFGYAVAASRPLALTARADRCTLCPENILLGAELYGGLGTHAAFGFRGTSQYLAPTVSLRSASGATFKISPGFGLTGSSAPFLFRFGVSYEIAQFGRALGRAFR